MIIENSAVALSSKRSYSKTAQTTCSTEKQQLSGDSGNIFLFTFNEEYTHREEESANSVAFNSRSNDWSGADYLISNTYNSKGLPNDIDTAYEDTNSADSDVIINIEEYDRFNALSSVGTVSKAESVEDLGEMFDNIRKRIFYSLLQLIDSLKFKSEFMDNPYYQSLSKSDDANGIINLTNNSGIASNSLSSHTVALWQITNSISSSYTEKECMNFSGTGVVTTADGREISFNIDVNMTREFTEENNLTFVGNYTKILTDPLVINLNDAPATISDKTFFFDLNCDGEAEEISSPDSSSGFLALDKNGDGIINDGSELFGSLTGNGFAELSDYDSDGNGWIDEADEIYKNLRVWVKDEDGNDSLMSLKEADVGAIYLDSVESDYSFTNSDNETLGKLRQSGLYLHEDGKVGSISQIDL